MQTQLRYRFGLLLAVCATGSACATVALAGGLPTGSSLGDPVLFLKRVVRQIAANDYGRAWETLIPSQQRAVPRATYVRCESASPIPGTLASIEVKAVADSRVQVAGADSD